MVRRKNCISEVFVLILSGLCLIVGSHQSSAYSYREGSNLQAAPAPGPYPKPSKPVKDNFPIVVVSKPTTTNGPKPIPVALREMKSEWAPRRLSDQDVSKHLKRKGLSKTWKAMPAPRHGIRQHDEPRSPYRIKYNNLNPKMSLMLKKPFGRRQNDNEDLLNGVNGGGTGDDGGGGGGGNCDNQNSNVPLMIIRSFDVMIPVGNGGKTCETQAPDEEEQLEELPEPETLDAENEDADEVSPGPSSQCATTPPPTQCPTPETTADSCLVDDADAKLEGGDDNWGGWSGCSASCGVGMQARSRLRPSGSPELDTQFRACRLADCPGPDSPAQDNSIVNGFNSVVPLG